MVRTASALFKLGSGARFRRLPGGKTAEAPQFGASLLLKQRRYPLAKNRSYRLVSRRVRYSGS
jgi:hypothetical protein